MKSSRLNAVILGVALAALSAHACAVSFWLSHSDGEFVDHGTVSVNVYTGDNSRIDCATGLTQSRNGNRITVVARRLPGTYAPGTTECTSVVGDLGTLAAGTYEIEARLLSLDGGLYESEKQSLVVLPLEGRCNADPLLRPTLITVHTTLTPEQMATKAASDPAYAERLGHPLIETGASIGDGHYAYLTYPTLVDPTVMSVRLHETGEFKYVGRNAYGCFSAAPPSIVKPFIEFYHAGLDHYFYSANANEIADIDAGKVGPWTRTGKSFNATESVGCPGTMDVVYRFNGIPGHGPSSHFFTRDRAECYKVDKSAQWALEGVPFHAFAPDAEGKCWSPNVYVPLYRVWRPFGDSNHRFTTDRAVVNEMTAKGWVDEGAAMCVNAFPM